MSEISDKVSFSRWDHIYISVHKRSKYDKVPCLAQAGFEPTFSDCESGAPPPQVINHKCANHTVNGGSDRSICFDQ